MQLPVYRRNGERRRVLGTHVHHGQAGRRAARTGRQDHQTVRGKGIQAGGHEVYVGESHAAVVVHREAGLAATFGFFFSFFLLWSVTAGVVRGALVTTQIIL